MTLTVENVGDFMDAAVGSFSDIPLKQMITC